MRIAQAAAAGIVTLGAGRTAFVIRAFGSPWLYAGNLAGDANGVRPLAGAGPHQRDHGGALRGGLTPPPAETPMRVSSHAPCRARPSWSGPAAAAPGRRA